MIDTASVFLFSSKQQDALDCIMHGAGGGHFKHTCAIVLSVLLVLISLLAVARACVCGPFLKNINVCVCQGRKAHVSVIVHLSMFKGSLVCRPIFFNICPSTSFHSKNKATDTRPGDWLIFQGESEFAPATAVPLFPLPLQHHVCFISLAGYSLRFWVVRARDKTRECHRFMITIPPSSSKPPFRSSTRDLGCRGNEYRSI